MKIGLLGAAVCAATLSSLARAASLPFVDVDATASYQNLVGAPAHQGLSFPQASLPATVTARSYVPKSGSTGFGDGNRVVAYDDADAMATSTVPGLDGAYARAGGWSPGGSPNDVVAESKVRVYSNWIASGPGPTAKVDLFTFFNGFLYTSSNASLSDLVYAKIAVDIAIDCSLGHFSLLSGTGLLNLKNGMSTSFTAANGWSPTAWTNSWSDTTSTMTSRNGRDFLWDQNYAENIDDIFEVPTGEVFGIDYTMHLWAVNAQGPFEIFATADYSHTSDIAMRSHQAGYSVKEVNLAVPEPGSIFALSIGALALLRRRRA